MINSMEVKVIRDSDRLFEHIPAWEDLAAAALEPNPFYEHWVLLPALRHFGAKQSKDERIGRLANSSDCCVGSLSFQATQASAIDKLLWILA